MRNQFTLQGNQQDFTQAVKKVGDAFSLLTVMTGVDHSKATTTDISVSIELVAEILSDAYECLTTLTIKGGNNE